MAKRSLVVALAVIALLTVAVPVAPPAQAWDGCGQWSGTPGITVKIGGEEVTVPPTERGLVGFCLIHNAPEPEISPLQTTPHSGCGTPCFTITGTVGTTGGYVGVELTVEGQPYAEPIWVDGTSLPICIGVGNPIPSCGSLLTV